ncbi:hypothetical protein [Arthrobacter sp. efr-133-R2A-120]|uniref:hypothetical protein n=1 Tax=Arthrobacter sp. efr-133-R2A-120 TaxID=3040277 RepID=UPI00254B92F4|nr:hypothetical protein [Arthrobacter sp. efr-133-R2A-120]
MTRRGDDSEERDKLIAALIRILKGQPENSSGRLSVKAVAEEARLARTALTHKHLDIKELISLCQDARAGEQAIDQSNRVAALTKENGDLKVLNERLAAQATLAAIAAVRPNHLRVV